MAIPESSHAPDQPEYAATETSKVQPKPRSEYIDHDKKAGAMDARGADVGDSKDSKRLLQILWVVMVGFASVLGAAVYSAWTIRGVIDDKSESLIQHMTANQRELRMELRDLASKEYDKLRTEASEEHQQIVKSIDSLKSEVEGLHPRQTAR